LTAQIEDALRIDIIEGVLKPGQRLRAADMAQRYNVSPTPLREALQRLAAQNLVDIDPRLGATVAGISREHLRDTYWVRELLETLALERSIERGDAEWERRAQAAFDDLRDATKVRVATRGTEGALTWSKAHRTFHETLLEAADSPWLKSILATLNDHSERYRMLSVQTGVRDSIEEHGAILTAALAHDRAAATASLKRHLSGTVDLLEHGLPTQAEASELALGGAGSRGQRS
jgi:DNA-binding GntR family transcriptional regulator